MDKETGYALNDLLDVVEELTKIVRDLNPGANYDFIDFLLARTSSNVGKALEALDARS